MPHRPRKPCSQPMCPELVEVGTSYCAKHQRAQREQENAERPVYSNRLYGRRWRKARAAFLSRNPLCAEHQRRGLIKGADVVDHIKRHKGDALLFWDVRNWQPLCTECHTAKTRR